ncbi:YihY/virulence factor BrkB family protein [Clostridium hydrogeniformans]|uniref:YihY/virulence factor BrkB family protein n=1 Tax=Clostridium hydrogeniformans TaxID=349933 RepID=UPI00068A2FB1|nr:YihY/virulence factor BrkB family protein [Clostridium hydrogeniformans]
MNIGFKEIRRFWDKLFKDDIFALASQLAYSLIVAFFPFLIFLMTLIGYLNLSPKAVLTTLEALLPTMAYDLIEETVRGILMNQNGNILSISLIITIWTAASGFRAIIVGLNKAYDTEESRGIISTFILSIIFTLAISLIIIAALVLLVFGKVLEKYLFRITGYDLLFLQIWQFLRYGVIVFIMIFVFILMYVFTPCKRQKWINVLPGAVFTTVGWIITSLGFSYYVNNFANYSRIYGSIGAVVILMTWLYLSSLIILLGGEVNAFLEE